MPARGPIRICERAKGVFEDYLAGAPARTPGPRELGLLLSAPYDVRWPSVRPARGSPRDSFLEDQTRPLWRPSTHPTKGQRNICGVPIRDYQSG